MPWKESTVEGQREEFVRLACGEGSNRALLCRRFGISRQTGYKWLARYRAGGEAALADRSRRPHHCPHQTPPPMEVQVLSLRQQHPAWGGRKLAARLEALALAAVPAPSTISAILHRHGQIDPLVSAQHRPLVRFEYAAPNDLWQMDFKGHFALSGGGRCHPLTALDDHSRYNLILQACLNQQAATVQEHLTRAFRTYGLPRRILADNGSPWGTSGGSIAEQWTQLTVWLLRLGVGVIHGRIYHPQTQGKEERFHRSLKAEVLRWRAWETLPQVQGELDRWRTIYNHQRPHEALGLAVPGSRYQPSPRSYPERLPAITYGEGDIVRQVGSHARLRWQGRSYVIGKAFAGYPVALRPTVGDGLWEVYFCQQCIGQLDQKAGVTLGRPRAAAPVAPSGLPTPPHAE